MIDPDSHAFPGPSDFGLTKREYFAAQFMAGLLASKPFVKDAAFADDPTEPSEELVMLCYQAWLTAEAFIEEGNDLEQIKRIDKLKNKIG